MFFAVEPEVTEYNDDLADQRYPEWSGSHRAALETLREVPCSDIREHAPWTDAVWRSCAGGHNTDRPNDLSESERGTDVQS